MTHAERSSEEFVRRFTRHEADVRAFVRSLMPQPEHVDDIMQEVSVAALRKFYARPDAEDGGFVSWVCAIARFEVLKYRRCLARDRLVLDEHLLSLLADEGIEEISLRARQRQALENCLNRLNRHCQLVLRAYGGERSIRALAEEIGKSPDSVYQILGTVNRPTAKPANDRVGAGSSIVASKPGKHSVAR